MDEARVVVTPEVVRVLAQVSGLFLPPDRAGALVPHVQVGLDASARLEAVPTGAVEPTFFLRPTLLFQRASDECA
ncbi:MAG: hypothetical protein QN178_10065 [Armatimonadota bacterium]|nr:hypothetical protein [Armatimonadota bacterium]